MTARCSGRARGFTLIELLVAMALATVGLLGLIALQSIAIRGNIMSRNFGEAIGIAQQRLELAERTPYASLTAMTPADPACSTDVSTAAKACQLGTDGITPDPNTTTQSFYRRCTTATDNGDNTTTVLTRVCWQTQESLATWHYVDLLTRRSP